MMKYMILLICICLILVTSCNTNSFNIKVDSISPLTSIGNFSGGTANSIDFFGINLGSNVSGIRSDFIDFTFIVNPPVNIQPDIRYFIQMYSHDGKFLNGDTIIWSKDELIVPEKPNASERDSRIIEAYKLQMANYPPSKSITLEVSHYDIATSSFCNDYDLANSKIMKDNQNNMNLQYSDYGIHVSQESLNNIFNRYFKITIHS